MPLFEFRCPKCGHKFEALMSAQRVKDAVCEKCGARESNGMFFMNGLIKKWSG